LGLAGGGIWRNECGSNGFRSIPLETRDPSRIPSSVTIVLTILLLYD
jgi:hypothetical protein